MALRQELRLSNFGFTYDHPEHFCISQWRIPQPFYIAILGLLTLYYTVAFIIALATRDGDSAHSAMVYLTIWTYLVSVLHFWVAWTLSVICIFKNRNVVAWRPGASSARVHETSPTNGHVNKAFEPELGNSKTNLDVARQKSPEIPASERNDSLSFKIFCIISWILFDIVVIISPIVTVVYFSTIFPSVDKHDWSDIDWYKDMSLHALNFVLVLVDFMLCARPVRLFHAIYPMIYGVIYGIFTTIYWSTDRENNVIYKILDYSGSPGLAAGVLLGLLIIVLPLLQLTFFGFYVLRTSIAAPKKS